MRKRLLSAVLIFVLALAVTGLSTQRAGAYYGGYGLYGGLYGGLMGGLYGGLYGGLMGGLYGGLYGGLMGGLYGMYGGGLYGMYGGGLYGMYGGGLYGGLYSPFGLQNMYYEVDTGSGLSYQVPFLQIAPLLGVAGMYNALFPSLFNPQSFAPAVPVATSLPVT
ncbi:MAG: hypothetical protein ACMUIA_02990 [bacterium]